MGPRVGAGTYLLLMSSTVNAWALIMIGVFNYALLPGLIDRAQAGYVSWGIGIPIGMLFYHLSRRRFQDLNCPGWCCRSWPFRCLV